MQDHIRLYTISTCIVLLTGMCRDKTSSAAVSNTILGDNPTYGDIQTHEGIDNEGMAILHEQRSPCMQHTYIENHEGITA